MPTKPVVSNGPVEVNTAEGQQFSIPLSALYFDDKGAVQADRWPQYNSTPDVKSAVDHWLTYLVKQSLIRPGDTPAPAPAFQIQARDPGSTGNSIVVSFANVTPNAADPASTTADVTVTETDTYKLLTPATLAAVLGTSPNGGSQPGLVFLATSNPTMPATDGGDLAGSPPQFAFGTSFTVQGKHDEADATLTHVTVQDTDTGAQTFTLVARWQKTANAVKLSDLATTFAYEITVTPPTGGFKAPPANGDISLTGGSDPIAPSKAGATVLTGS